MKNVMLVLLCLATVVLASCVQVPTSNETNTSTTDPLFVIEQPTDISVETEAPEPTEPVEEEATEEEVELTPEPEQEEEPEVVEEPESSVAPYTKTVLEGELVSLKRNLATDEDGDSITYSFAKPLDRNGEWQTQIGDAGEYDVDILASDGDLTSRLEVRIIVQAVNAPPTIQNFDDVTLEEGETVLLNPSVSDRDGDSVSIEFTGWMTASERETTFDDAGEYEVTLTADDGTTTVERTITVTVENVNRAPQLSGVEDVEVVEGDIIRLTPSANDPDGDTVTLTFSAPFDEDGEWQTRVGEAALYPATITATDGDIEVVEELVVTVSAANTAPTLLIDERITVTEGDTVRLDPDVSDADGDEIRVSYSGWMSTATKETSFDDAGEYSVTVTATDGKERTEVEITVVVENVNRPPVFSENPFN